MPYPKPLSDKRIRKMLDNWDPKTAEIILDHYQLCADMYGLISLEDAWEVATIVKLPVSREEFYQFSDIARRMELPYYIAEEADIYGGKSTEPVNQRLILNERLIGRGSGKFRLVKMLDYNQVDVFTSVAFFAEENLADILPHAIQMEELKEYLDNLQLPDGTPLSEDYRLLPHFDTDKKLLEDGSLPPKANRPTPEKLLERMILECHAGVPEAFQHINYTLRKLGVPRNPEEMYGIMIECYEKSRWWCLCGYTPAEVNLLYDSNNEIPAWRMHAVAPPRSETAMHFMDLIEKIYSMPVEEVNIDIQPGDDIDDEDPDDIRTVKVWQKKHPGQKYN